MPNWCHNKHLKLEDFEKKHNIQKREFVGFIGAGEGIRIYHSLQLTHVIQQILRKLY